MTSSLVQIALEGARLNALLVSAIELELPDELEGEALSVPELAERAGISERGCQALADGLVGLRLWRVSKGRYSNTETARRLLTRGSPEYLGQEQPFLFRFWLDRFRDLSEQVRSGRPAQDLDSQETLEFWSHLTPFLARNAGGVARAAVERFGLARGPLALLDVGGGGAGLYARAVLEANPEARVAQADWPHVNAQAREALGPLAERFETLDGDFHHTDFGSGRFDAAVLSNVIHQESPESNREILRRVGRALRPGGRVVLSDWITDDDRAGPPGALFFNLTMLLLSPEGKTYTRSEVASMLRDAGFAEPEFAAAPGQELLAGARKR